VALVWFGISLLAAALALVVIRRFFGARRTMRRMALSLAVCERALEDALGELVTADPEEPANDDLFVSPFEPVVLRLLAIPEADIAALGKPAAELRARLSSCIRAWNAAAGRTGKRASLLPLVLEAHHVARQLAPFVEESSLSAARSVAKDRVLVALVAAEAQGEAWLQ
jgi:hypothetical protein